MCTISEKMEMDADVEPDRRDDSALNTANNSLPSLNTDSLHRRSSAHASPKTPTLRRPISSTSLNNRPSSSPALVKKNSRQSLGALEDGEKRPTPKRSISNLISGLREAQAKMESIEEPIALTAPELATAHFMRELSGHEAAGTTADTVVIVHDACYGHRYSRPKTSKSTLSMIVERPERLQASVLGTAAAYVRLGGHHAGGKNAPHPGASRSDRPPFKIRRTARSLDIASSYVTNVHGTAWMSELRTLCNAAGARLANGAKELSRSSTPTEPAKRKLHEGDLYLSSESLNAFQGALGGVADAVDTVFSPATRTKRAFVAVRPPGHHCSADYPSGFCWLNNVHVGIEYAAQTYDLTHAVILDFDLHHGDGSQAITWERNSSNNVKRQNAKPNSKLKLGPDIGYYSLHDINSYPCEMGDDEKVQAASLCIENAHGQSIWNVHLQPWKTEKEFWDLYETKYRVLLDKARLFLQHHTSRLKAEGRVTPRPAVFISAGFDASEWEGAGMQRHKVNVPTEFYARFTRDAVELAEDPATGCDGRLVSVLEGGYSDRALCSGVLSHLSGLCAVPGEIPRAGNSDMDGLDQMMQGLGIDGTGRPGSLSYNKTWWSPANLTALEMKVNPPPPTLAKKGRVGQQPTYATPTESFAYKVVDANKFARSISGTMREVQQPARPPTPPPPEVDWVIATQELHKLLIPSNRQISSCTAEELAGPKVKKEISSTIQAPLIDEAPRQLRDRKTKGPAQMEEIERARTASRNSRRQTIAELPSASAQPDPIHQRRASRRLSAGSALSSLADLDMDPPPVPVVPSGAARESSAMPPPAAPPQGVQVKKTRAPAKKETVSSTPASPKWHSKQPPRLSGPSNTAVPTKASDVDALTSGMKKVTLKVGSKEEHERKQKEKIDNERRARALKAAETRKANVAAKKAAQASPGFVPKSGVEQVEVQAKENTAPPPVLPTSEGVDMDMQSPLPLMQGAQDDQPNLATSVLQPLGDTSAEVAVVEHSQVPAITSETAADHGYGTGYELTTKDKPLTPRGQHLNNQQALQSSTDSVHPMGMDSASRQLVQEHNLAYPASPAQRNLPAASAARSPSGAKMPIWSSTGTIPFATAGLSSSDQRYDSLKASTAGPENSAETIVGAASMASANDILHKKEGDPPSIWDVPVTPQK